MIAVETNLEKKPTNHMLRHSWQSDPLIKSHVTMDISEHGSCISS